MSKRVFSDYADDYNGIESGIYDPNPEQGTIRTLISNDCGYLTRRYKNASSHIQGRNFIPVPTASDLSIYPREPVFVLRNDENQSGNYDLASKTKGIFSALNGIEYTFCKTSRDLTRRLRFLGYWGLGYPLEGDITKGNSNGIEEATIITSGPLTIINNGDYELDVGDLVGYRVKYYDVDRGLEPREAWITKHRKEGVTNRPGHVTPELVKLDPSLFYEEYKSLLYSSFTLWSEGGDSLDARKEHGSETYDFALSQLKEIASIGAMTLMAGIESTKIKMIPRDKKNDNEETRDMHYRAYELADKYLTGALDQTEFQKKMADVKAEFEKKKPTTDQKMERINSHYKEIARETGWHNYDGDGKVGPNTSQIMETIVRDLKYSIIPSKNPLGFTIATAQYGTLVEDSIDSLTNSIANHAKFLLIDCFNFAGLITKSGGPGETVDILMTKLVK